MKSLVILAGGKSSRMGQDKLLLKLNGKTFIERVFLNALECFERVIISTDTTGHADEIMKLPAFAGRETEIVTDRYKEMGPMGGICSVFEACDVNRFSIISVDVPFADMKVLAALYDRCSGKAIWLKVGERRPEPLIAAYDRSAYEDLKNSLDAGLLKIRLAVPENDVEIVTSEELAGQLTGDISEQQIAEAFRNINTPEEYGQIEKKIWPGRQDL